MGDFFSTLASGLSIAKFLQGITAYSPLFIATILTGFSIRILRKILKGASHMKARI